VYRGFVRLTPERKGYRTKIEAELEKICEDILSVLDEHLIKSAESGESKVFYAKVCTWDSSRSFCSRRFSPDEGRLPPVPGRVCDGRPPVNVLGGVP
jgi:hypothetical protein